MVDSRRRLLITGIVSAPLLAACAGQSAVGQIIDSYRELDRARKNYPVSRATIDAQSHAVMGAQMEGGAKGLLVLERRDEQGLDYWRSGNGVVVVLQGGRLMRCSGFTQDQLGSQLASGFDPIALTTPQPLDRTQRYRFSRDLDLAPATFGLRADCELYFVGSGSVDLLGEVHAVDEWQERVRLPFGRKRWTQRWQVDAATGQIWRSVQNVGLESRMILERLKA
jgi:Group 4 capsule polysaccharide lipoprotein gfcB, YjbF